MAGGEDDEGIDQLGQRQRHHAERDGHAGLEAEVRVERQAVQRQIEPALLLNGQLAFKFQIDHP